MNDHCVILQQSERERQVGLSFEVIVTRWSRGLYVLAETVDRLLGLDLTESERDFLATAHGWLYGAYEYARRVQERGGDLKIPVHRG